MPAWDLPLAFSTDVGTLVDQYANVLFPTNALQFHGVPNGTYNRVVYGIDGIWADRGTTFVVHDALNGDQTKSTMNAAPSAPLAEGSSFVVFSNIHASGGTLNVDVGPNPDAHGGGNTDADINAAQLQLVSLDTPPPSITINSTVNGSSMALSWTQGILQTSTNLSGPWTPIYAPSPITATTTNATQFFRVKVQ